MRVSIVTISYNQGRFLEEAITSVVDQRSDRLDVEYIVVDAGSTDGTPGVLEQFGPEIDVLITEPDAGPASGLNKGFAMATGDVFGFLNADDRLEPGALKEIADYFNRNDSCDAVVGALRIIDESSRPYRWGSRLATSVQMPLPFNAHRFMDNRVTVLQQSTFFTPSAWIAVGGFNEANHSCWDTELFVDMALAGITFGTIDQILAAFRIYGDSLTGSGANRAATEADLHRIKASVRSTGLSPSVGPIAAISRLAWLFRPRHRARQWAMERKAPSVPQHAG